jgi:hypothetical protein
VEHTGGVLREGGQGGECVERVELWTILYPHEMTAKPRRDIHLVPRSSDAETQPALPAPLPPLRGPLPPPPSAPATAVRSLPVSHLTNEQRGVQDSPRDPVHPQISIPGQGRPQRHQQEPARVPEGEKGQGGGGGGGRVREEIRF